MTHQYTIGGMTCSGCRSKVEKTLNAIEGIQATVSLDPPIAEIKMQNHIPLQHLQDALSRAGKYTIEEGVVEATTDKHEPMESETPIHQHHQHHHALENNPKSGGKYYCPMHCEGEKVYDKPGNCPVCGMNLEKVLELEEVRQSYTCPMHPEIIKDSPGSCPICGMDLVPMEPTEKEDKKVYLDLLFRMKIATAFTIPVFLIAMLEMMMDNPLESIMPVVYWNWTQFILTLPVVFYACGMFFVRAWKSIITWNLNMFTLIGIGTGTAFLFSVFGMFFPAIFPDEFKTESGTVLLYFEATTVILTLVLLGQLEEAIRKLNKTMEASQDIICSFDDHARFVDVNAACERVWGYTPAELIGKVCFDFVHPQDLSETSHTDVSIKAGNPQQIFENRYIHKFGHVVYMLWSAKWDEDEQLMYCVAKDITEKKKLEKICEIERERFMDLYYQAPCCMGILKGPDHVFEMANPLYLQLIDKQEDIIGKPVREVLPELKQQGIFELLDAVYSTGESFIANEKLVQFNFSGTTKLTDKYLNFLYQAHRNNNGDIDGILFFAVDVTEQVLSRLKIEESVRLYRKLIRELPVAAYSCDAQGRIEIYNKAAALLWGREPEIGKEMWCGSHNVLSAKGKPIPHEMCPMAVALGEGRTVSGTEIIVERENGERRNILPHAVPYFNSAQEITGAVTVLTDITDTKKSALSLQQQNDMLLKANRELDRFVYSVSHDLRSPLTSILGIASFIESESAEPETIAHIKMIKESINRLDGFIRKILSYSKNNRTNLELEPINPTKEVQRIVDALQNMVPGNDIDFNVEIEEKSILCCDKMRFRAIVENLISNAIKYHDPMVKNKFVKIVGRVTKKAFHFSVSDNGIGIDPQYHDRIFDMFFRISSSSEGSGIGLYIVKDMVEKLDGSIKVDTTPDSLTVFNVKIKNFFTCQK